MTAPNPQPLIKSIFELPSRSYIKLVTDKFLNTNTILSVYAIPVIIIYY